MRGALSLLRRAPRAARPRSPGPCVQEPFELLLEKVESPLEGVESPLEGVESPLEGIESLFEDIESPLEGIESLFEDIESPLEGIESPLEPGESVAHLLLKAIECEFRVLTLLDEVLRYLVEALVYTVEALVDVVEALVDFVETYFDLAESLIDGHRQPIEASLDDADPTRQLLDPGHLVHGKPTIVIPADEAGDVPCVVGAIFGRLRAIGSAGSEETAAIAAAKGRIKSSPRCRLHRARGSALTKSSHRSAPAA